MSRRYHAHFPPTGLTRAELHTIVSPHLTMAGMNFSGECYELQKEQGNGEFIFSYNERVFQNVEEVLENTIDWDGVMIEYDTPFGNRSITFFTTEKEENFGFDDTSGLYFSLTENDERLQNFENLLLDLCGALNAQFVLYFFNTPYKRVCELDLFELLSRLPTSRDGARPPLVVLHDSLRVPPEAAAMLDLCFEERSCPDYRIFREKHIFSDV